MFNHVSPFFIIIISLYEESDDNVGAFQLPELPVCSCIYLKMNCEAETIWY